MRRITKILFVIFFVRLFSSPFETSVNALFSKDGQNGNNIHLLSSTDEGVTFEVHFPSDQLNEEIKIVGGKKYLSLSMPGWSQISREGNPALPVIIETIGVPFDVEFEVSVSPGKKFTKVLSHPVLPVETQFIDWGEQEMNEVNLQSLKPSYKMVANEDVYGTNQAFPGTLAEVTSDGILRQQRLVGMGVYPIQYIPSTGELIIYESLQVTIKFSGLRSKSYETVFSDSAIYEDLYQGLLLNYETATKWRQEPTRLTMDSANRAMPWMPPDPGWRVLVREEGFYKLEYDELYSAGLPVDTLNPQTFQLIHQGGEVAIQVQGEDDGRFDSGDYILFYGQGINSKYTADNVYWLTHSNTIEGLRMGTKDVAPGSAETPPSYLDNLYMEVNNNYRSTAPGDEILERWFWDYILTTNPEDPQSWTDTFSLQNPYNGSAKFEIMIMGSLQNSINPDHHVEVYLQNTQTTTLIGESWWDGITWELLEIHVEPGLLQKGDNTILIVCPADTGVGYDFVYIDWIRLVFINHFTAVEDQLDFSYREPGTWKYQVEGFSMEDVVVYDVTDPTAVEQLTGISVNPFETGYMVQYEDTILTPKNYWAMTAAKAMTVQGIEQDVPSSLHASINGAEHLIITHGAFSTQAETLRSFRESQGLESKWVDVQDIYDEFNFGIDDVIAIRNFLSYTIAYWDLYPTFVVMFGDGHYDPKNYSGLGMESYIPPYLASVDPYIGETSADNRYVALVGDDILPDMMLGRLAVNTSEEASAVIEKIMTYENDPPVGDWHQKILAVTDDLDNAGNFYLISDNLINCCLPDPFNADKVYYRNTHMTVEETRSAIQTGINSGKLIINYIGHGSTTQWGGLEGAFLTASDVSDLNNGDKMPIMLPMTCMDGYYINPGGTQQSFAETITSVAGKGAIASWAPTGWGTVSGHDILNRGFFKAAFQSGDGMLTLGSATQAGKIDLYSTGTNQDLMDTYLLFGDPATSIAFDFTAVNDKYVVEEDSILNISEGEEGKRGVLHNDIHPQNLPLTAILVENATNGQLDFHSDGSFTYTPNPNYFGKDSFTYYASDGVENSNIAVVEIIILSVDEKIFLPVIQIEVD